ncbi:hypothetical protein NKG94_15940 [Micromonospora sp. M12]
MSCGLASTTHWNGALSAFFVLLSSTPLSGVKESAPIRSTTSTV